MTKETRKIGICLFLLIFTIQAQSQFGIATRYQANQANNWDEIIKLEIPTASPIFQSSYEFAIDYLLPLKSVRIDFLPEVSIAFANSEIITSTVSYRHTYLQYGAGIKARIYFFDLFGDCSCPTFSRQGATLQKGFFIQLNSGAYYLDKTIEEQLSEISYEQIDKALRFGFGVGIDIGISKFFTLTPVISYQIIPNADWRGFSAAHNIENISPADERSSINSIQAEIRFGFNLQQD